MDKIDRALDALPDYDTEACRTLAADIRAAVKVRAHDLAVGDQAMVDAVVTVVLGEAISLIAHLLPNDLPAAEARRRIHSVIDGFMDFNHEELFGHRSLS